MQPNTDNSIADTESTKDTRWNHLLTQTASDFAENTTLNGLKYMAEKGSTILERIFWISTFILSTILCILMVYKSYVKYDNSGVVVTLKEQLVSVNEYPFPAVTICPQARIRKMKSNFGFEAISAFKNSVENWTDTELKKFHSTLVLCDNDAEIDSSDTYAFLNYTIDIGKFFEVAPRHEDILMKCSWRNKADCKKSFRPVLTADGICYTFNILATDEMFRKKSVHQKRYYLNTSTPQKGWSLEKNYIRFENTSFPRRGRANGAREDLYLTLKEVTDREFACDFQTRPGYKVYLHHPADLPQASLHHYAAQPGKTTSLAIKLDILDTAEELLRYAPKIRQCYFPNERYLQFFQSYTSSNCQLECLTNYTIQICGCASYYMPRNESTSICKANKWQCIQDALDKYAAEEDLSKGEISQCQCMPSCKTVNYDADVILTKLDLEEYNRRKEEFDKLVEEMYDYSDSEDEDEDSYEPSFDYFYENSTDSETTYDNTTGNVKKEVMKAKAMVNLLGPSSADYQNEFTEIRIYYRRPRFVAMERSELVGLPQFLADVGGTLGLFLGFSFLTLAEIFYFFTLKLYCSFQQQTSPKKDDTASEQKNI